MSFNSYEFYKQLKAEQKQKRDELIFKLVIGIIGAVLIWLTIK
jgi:uncharacterized membrane-anchored protein